MFPSFNPSSTLSCETSKKSMDEKKSAPYKDLRKSFAETFRKLSSHQLIITSGIGQTVVRFLLTIKFFIWTLKICSFVRFSEKVYTEKQQLMFSYLS